MCLSEIVKPQQWGHAGPLEAVEVWKGSRIRLLPLRVLRNLPSDASRLFRFVKFRTYNSFHYYGKNKEWDWVSTGCWGGNLDLRRRAREYWSFIVHTVRQGQLGRPVFCTAHCTIIVYYRIIRLGWSDQGRDAWSVWHLIAIHKTLW
jgi:hypothetical protein